MSWDIAWQRELAVMPNVEVTAVERWVLDELPVLGLIVFGQAVCVIPMLTMYGRVVLRVRSTVDGAVDEEVEVDTLVSVTAARLRAALYTVAISAMRVQSRTAGAPSDPGGTLRT